jgi:excisionase family DNA binding protein
MAETIDGLKMLTVTEAAEHMGCTDGWVRMLLLQGRLVGRKFGERLWLIPFSAAEEAKASLSVRSVGKREQKPATQKKRRKTR